MHANALAPKPNPFGETSCGKSVTGRAIMRLIDPPGEITGGSIRFDNREVTQFDQAALRALRGREISMIFQNPGAALNPLFSIGQQRRGAQRDAAARGLCFRAALPVRDGRLSPAARAVSVERQARRAPSSRVLFASGTRGVMKTLLQIRDLSVEFRNRDRRVRVINQLDLDVFEGETLGVVAVIGLPAPRELKTAAALKVVGPPAFGYDIPFTPMPGDLL